jgi:hypothetical protein
MPGVPIFTMVPARGHLGLRLGTERRCRAIQRGRELCSNRSFVTLATLDSDEGRSVISTRFGLRENAVDAHCATMSYTMEVVDDYANHTS